MFKSKKMCNSVQAVWPSSQAKYEHRKKWCCRPTDFKQRFEVVILHIREILDKVHRGKERQLDAEKLVKLANIG